MRIRLPFHKSSIASWAKLAPLGAALLAPVATLLNIPGLSQKWYTTTADTSQSVPDPKACLILSAIGLTFNVWANALLVGRFSAGQKRWELLTKLSAVAWVLTTVIALVNIILFGALTRNGPRFHYLEGFWCAVFNLVISGLCTVMLLFHYFAQVGKDKKFKDDINIRIAGRHFITSLMALLALIAIQALIFSKIEGWEYFDGIYYSVITMLTIGYGDFAPAKTSTRILLFPFVICSIALLANQISMIINFFGERNKSRRRKWRAKFIREAQQLKTLSTKEVTTSFLKRRKRRAVDDFLPSPEGNEKPQQSEDDAEGKKKANDEASREGRLDREVLFLRGLERRERVITEAYDLFYSLLTFAIFWVAGGLIFGYIEGWGVGIGLYFTYVSFLALGYGDYSPATPLGKVILVLYGLMAVPIITSFAVQTITAIVTQLSSSRYQEEEERRGLGKNAFSALFFTKKREQGTNKKTYFQTHESFVLAHHRTLDKEMEKLSKQLKADQEKGNEGEATSEVHSMEEHLAQEVLQLACTLEAQARHIMVKTLPHGSHSEVLLRADRNVQERDLEALDASEDQRKLFQLWQEERDQSGSAEGDEESTLKQIVMYRETFAKLLATGSRLRKLQGIEQHRFERRLQLPGDSDDEENNEDKHHADDEKKSHPRQHSFDSGHASSPHVSAAKEDIKAEEEAIAGIPQVSRDNGDEFVATDSEGDELEDAPDDDEDVADDPSEREEEERDIRDAVDDEEKEEGEDDHEDVQHERSNDAQAKEV